MHQGSLCGMLRGVSSKGHKQREGRTGEESNVSGYDRASSDVAPGADGVGSRRHHVRQPVRARSAISYLRVLQPGARRYNFYKRSTVYRFGQLRPGSAKKWWSCHPSACGVAATWVGHPDLRDPQAQVAEGVYAVVRQGRCIVGVVAFLIGCAFLLVVGCAGVGSEAPQREQGSSPEATASEEGRCGGTSTTKNPIGGEGAVARFTTNDLPGCPKGGHVIRGLGGRDELWGGSGNDVIYGGDG